MPEDASQALHSVFIEHAQLQEDTGNNNGYHVHEDALHCGSASAPSGHNRGITVSFEGMAGVQTSCPISA